MTSIRGIILRADGEELIVKASPIEVAKFASAAASSAPAIVQRMSMSMEAANAIINGSQIPMVAPGQTLFDQAGHPVAIVEMVHVSRVGLDVTTFSDVRSHHVQARPLYCSIQARGL